MAYIELHQSVWTHRKTFVFAADLGIDKDLAVVRLAKLWQWALDNAPSGDLSGVSDAVISFGADWDGDPNQFVSALVQSRYLNANKTLHNWEHYGGKLAYRKKANADRMKKAREMSTNKDCAQHVLDTCATQNANVQSERRGEESIEEESIKETPLPPSSKPKAAATAELNGIVADLFDHFKTRMGKPEARLTDKHRTKVIAYLKRSDCRSPDDLKLCIDHAAEDSFYRSMVHNGLSWFIGTEDSVEKFFALDPNRGKSTNGNSKTTAATGVTQGKYAKLIEDFKARAQAAG